MVDLPKNVSEPNASTTHAMQELQNGKEQKSEDFTDFLANMEVLESDKAKILAKIKK